MNYIYDILLNFQSEFYDFYEWNLNDDILHIRKIPLFKVEDQDLFKIRNVSIKVPSSFLTSIFNKTEVFTSRNVKNISYACLFSDGKSCCAVLFDEDGKITAHSSLLIDEESEVLGVVSKLDIEEFLYEEGNACVSYKFMTRKEQAIQSYIDQEMKRLIQEDDVSKLKYLYYECFDEKEEDKEMILSKIQGALVHHFDHVYLSIYNFLKLTSIKR